MLDTGGEEAYRPHVSSPDSQEFLQERRIRIQLQIRLQELTVGLALLDGVGPVTSSGQCHHATDHEAAVVAIQGQSVAPPFRSLIPTSFVLRPLGQSFQRFEAVPLEPCPLVLHPPFKLRRPRQVKPVEQGSMVQGRGCRELSGAPGLGEVPDIGRDDDGIQEETVAPVHHGVLPEGFAQAVEGASEVVAGTILIAFRPQERHETLPAAAESAA